MTRRCQLIHLPLVLAMICLAACSGSQPAEPSALEEETAADYERGPHRGRLLRDGDFALELQIFEEGVPPEYHVYLYSNGKPLPPDAATVTVELTRLGGQTDRFQFEPRDDYLLGDGTVTEPHSFSVVVTAAEGGKKHQWSFDSFEGRTTIPAQIAHEAGISTETVGSAVIADTLTLTGRVVPDPERIRRVTARFPGPIRAVPKSIGDRVAAGDTLAMVESNDSLQRYAITAPIAGTVIERHANPGESAGSEPLFVIADYDEVWVELLLFPGDLARVRPGQRVQVSVPDGALEGEGLITRVVPADGSASRSSSAGIYTAVVELDNADGRWTPGLFVRGQVRIGEAEVPVAVKRSGLQAFRDFTVVFEQIGDTYEVRMLDLGRQDDTWVEVLGGIEPGARYVAENSYLIKADIEKSGASHDH